MTVTATREERASVTTGPTPRARRLLLAGILLSLLTPALVWLANPPLTLWPLILVAFVPMAVAQHYVLPARWSPLAVGIGFGGSYAAYFSWGLAGGEVGIVYQLLPVYVGLIAAGLAWRSRRFQERTDYRWFVVSFPLVWTAIEFLRSSGSETAGGTWGFHTYTMFEHPTLLQPIAVTGVIGLQLLIVLVNFAVAGVVLARLSGHAPRRM